MVYLKKYFLPVGFIAMLILLAGIFQAATKSKVHWDFVFVTFLWFVVGSLLISGIGYWLIPLWRRRTAPKRQDVLLNSEPFASFVKNGFCINENDYLEGEQNGYAVGIAYQWPHSFIAVIVSFNPEISDGVYYTLKQLEAVYKTASTSIWKPKAFFWGAGYLKYQYNITFKTPTYEQVKEKIDTMVGILKAANLPPEDRVLL